MAPRIPYKDIPEKLARTVPPEGHLNLWRMLAYAEEVWPAWMRTGTKLLTATVLEPRLRELIILRIGHLQDCPYEVAQHDPIARRLGVTEEQLTALADGDRAPALGFTEAESAALAAVTELLDGKQVSDHTFAQLQAQLDDRAVVELLLLVAQYAGLALFLNALQVDIDQTARLVM